MATQMHDTAERTFVARVLATPAGEIEQDVDEDRASAYGAVEVVWYPDRLRITAFGAGRASLTDTCLSGRGQDLTLEVRLPTLEELAETVPGAD